MRSIWVGTEVDSKGGSGIGGLAALEELFDQGFVASSAGAVIGLINTEIFLIDFGIRMIVGVFVALPVVELFSSQVVAIAEVARNCNSAIVLDVSYGGPNSHGRSVGLFGGG